MKLGDLLRQKARAAEAQLASRAAQDLETLRSELSRLDASFEPARIKSPHYYDIFQRIRFLELASQESVELPREHDLPFELSRADNADYLRSIAQLETELRRVEAAVSQHMRMSRANE